MMINEKNQTIAYYDDPANAYADQTVHADMSASRSILRRAQQCWTLAAEAVGTVCTL